MRLSEFHCSGGGVQPKSVVALNGGSVKLINSDVVGLASRPPFFVRSCLSVLACLFSFLKPALSEQVP